MNGLKIMIVIGLIGVLAAGVYAADKKAKAAASGVNKGDAAPEFSAKDDEGKDWKASEHVGKKIIVVYFYPADMTGGCTKQACGFRDDMSVLQGKGVEVVGVSGDSVKNHQIFKKVYKLNYALLADEKGDVAKAFGVPVGKGGSITRKIDGADTVLTRGVTAKRWTFVIGLDKKIAYKNTKVNAAKDSKAIIELIEKLKEAKPSKSK